MPRVRRGFKARRRRNKWLKLAKGFKHGRGTMFRKAKETILRALVYAYRDRRQRKRQFRRLWIARINAAARLHGVNYSRLIHLLDEKKVELDRKVLADIAVHDPEGFGRLVEMVKA
ncbi:MAG: 50S ribosomal protein L20 [Deltaproteobacteria bacterium CG2_30_63_29]|nr:MAG: 50S ribosomal protein L20 [Deltaproteobacteria bacterium CG2_30_63_29]PJB34728.1 MAG: 50S ribosomal protein L20 [Deltaproteobacteria bacterium CG_4_9_14_3_um_filter_63_12]